MNSAHGFRRNACKRHTWVCRGWAVSVTQVLLMASPLSGLLKAIQDRSSANFHLGMCAAGLLTSCLWAIYAMVSPLLLRKNIATRTGQGSLPKEYLTAGVY